MGIDITISSTGITTNDAVSAYLGTNSYSTAQITAAVNAANEAVQQYCQRDFTASTRREWIWLDGTNAVRLKDYPLIRLTRCSFETRDAMSIEYTNTSAVAASVSITDTVLTISAVVPGSSKTGYQEFTLSDYTSMAALETAIEAQTGTDGTWSVEVLQEDFPTAIQPKAHDDCLNQKLYPQIPFDVAPAHVDTLSGLITLTTVRNGWVFVEYRAGYETVPADVQQVATELAAAILATKDSAGGTLASVKLGDAAYSYREVSNAMAPFEVRLAPYRNFHL